MKKIIFLLSLALASCSEMLPGNGSFIVNDVEESPHQSKYQLIPTEGRGQIWITAGVGQYHVGDTLYLSK